MEYISKHKIDNITATLPMSFLFFIAVNYSNQRQSFCMYNCFNYNQNNNVYRYTKHVYLKKEMTQIAIPITCSLHEKFARNLSIEH